jgi:hypothetical protein
MTEDLTMHTNSKLFSVRLWALVIIALVLVVATTACGGDSKEDSATELKMAHLSELPAEVQSAPPSVQKAYQFAVANPEVLSEIPCYCGCGPMGHDSNHACYVSGEKDDGSPIFYGHALGCSICVDITQDTMRLMEQGKSVPEIRAYVDETYSQYGPSNMP